MNRLLGACVFALFGCSEYQLVAHGDRGDGAGGQEEAGRDPAPGETGGDEAANERPADDEAAVSTSGGSTGDDVGSGGESTDGSSLDEEPEALLEEPCKKVCLEGDRLKPYLDAYQVPDDGRVYFCHCGSQNGVEIETDISACDAHYAHTKDAFPTTLCDS
jgi:hypothetical protein